MRVDELDRLVSQEFRDRSREIVEAYRCHYLEATPFDLYATIAAACVRRPAFEQASRKATLGAAPAYSYIYAWRTPVLDGRPGSFHGSEITAPSAVQRCTSTRHVMFATMQSKRD